MSFTYKGFTFQPLRKFQKRESWDYVARHVSTRGVFLSKASQMIGTVVGGWDYDDFYKASGNSKCDIFTCDEHPGMWVPGPNYLNRYEG